MKLTTLAVFCGSKAGLNPQYSNSAVVLAKALIQKNITLVYGGGKVGIMGILADAMLASGGKVDETHVANLRF